MLRLAGFYLRTRQPDVRCGVSHGGGSVSSFIPTPAVHPDHPLVWDANRAGMDQLLTPEFWKVQIEVATSALWVVIPLLLISGIIGWRSKGIIDDRKIRGLRTEINTREQRLQQAHDKQELVANQVKILRDAVMQEYAKLKKTKKMSLEQEATDLVGGAYNANKAARSSLSALLIANNALGATLAPTDETGTRASLVPNISEEFDFDPSVRNS
jgi:hypothetical protein